MGVVNRDASIVAGYARLRQFARFALGRILGTIESTRGQYKYFLDIGESKLFHRAELNAITKILHDKKIVTAEEWSAALDQELAMACKDQQENWPEVTPAQDGSSYSLDIHKWKERVDAEKWPP